jgi:L-2-hydroxyglutarate oxidase
LAGSPSDALDTLRYRGFWNLAKTHWRTGVAEQWRSLNKAAFVRNARAMLPDLDRTHLGAFRAGVRAQAVLADGTLVHDFVIKEGPGSVNVLNAPSPAATSCLTIGEHIATRAVAQL